MSMSLRHCAARAVLPFALSCLAAPALAQSPLQAELEKRIAAITPKVMAWRRDLHEHPELGNREFRTSKLVADHLRSLGIEVRTEVAHTGVVGVLKGGKAGPVVALRADMDALPVTEQVDLPFASKVRAEYNGQQVGVMHACGHDNHVAILMGVAEVLAGMKQQLPGTVLFLFQPAEEGAPEGEEGGAQLMLKEGAFTSPKPAAVFGLHVTPLPVGTIGYRAGGSLAAADELRIIVRGRQTHGATPWGGVDPVLAASQIVVGLQSIVARQMNITTAPAVVTIGMINGGVRNNIIPDSVVLVGTVRTLDPAMQKDVHARIKRTAESIAQASGATAEVQVKYGYPVTVNDAALTQWAVPTLTRAAGKGNAYEVPAPLWAEDFSYYAQLVPGFFVFLGIVPKGQDPTTAATNHSPRFFADEAALPVGMKTLAGLAVDYMSRR